MIHHSSFRLIKALSACSILLLISPSKLLLSQPDYNLEKVIPPSPTAASLGAFGDFPVNYYTGQAGITLPVYQIKTSQHQLDISLSYNSNIRVNQDASWIGLGWALNAGGVITRTVRGNNDFHDDITMGLGYYYSAAIPTPDYKPEDGPPDTEIYKTFTVGEDYLSPQDSVGLFFQSALEGRIDTEPDIFYYNFAGYSGSFVLGKQADGSKVYLKNSSDNLDIKINLIDSDYGAWTVTTPNGYKYYFSSVETSRNLVAKMNMHESEMKSLGPYTGPVSDPGTPWAGSYAFKSNSFEPEFASAWYLDYVEAPNGERITFRYYDPPGKTLSTINTSQIRHDKLQDIFIKPAFSYTDPSTRVTCFWNPTIYQNTYLNHTQSSRQIINTIYLDKIEFKNGRVELFTNARKDIESFQGENVAQKLSTVVVYSGSKIVRYIDFKQDYFNTSYQNSTGDNLRYTMCRLKLDSIVGLNDKPWKFDYYDPDLLPSKYSKKVDDWGYYNPAVVVKSIGDIYWSDQSAAPTWLPEVVYNGTVYPGTTRSPDQSGIYSRRGILSKITYPTKGFTVFDYEPNQIKLSVPETVETYTNLGVAKNGGNFLPYQDNHKDTVSVGNGQYTLRFWAYPTYADPPVSSSVALAWIKNLQGTILETFYLTNQENTIEERMLFLSSGYYIVEVKPIADHSIELAFGQKTTTSTYKKVVGGVRIGSIRNYNTNGELLTQKRLFYTNDGYQNGESSGVLLEDRKKYKILNQEKYAYIECSCIPFQQGGCWFRETEALFLKRSSNSFFPLGFNSPNGIVGYNKVFEIIGEDQQNGKILFVHQRELPTTYNPETYLAYPNLGDITRVTVYNNNNDIVSNTTNQYQTKKLEYLYGINLSDLFQLENPCLMCPFRQEKRIPYYLDYSEWYVVNERTKKLYDENGDQEFVTTENFSYNSSIHKQLSSKTTLGSDGSELRTEYKYPSDYPSEPVFQQMVDNRILSPLVEDLNYKNNSFVSGSKTFYKHFGGRIFLPDSTQLKYRNNTNKTVLRYHSYNSKGNPTEVSTSNGVHVVYLWGYNYVYPIAKIENATYAEVMTALGRSAVDTLGYLQNYSNVQLQTEIQKIRSHATMTNSFVTTYLYQPLVGLAKVIDQNGEGSEYTYDNFNRLRFIKDDTQKLLQEFKYNYKD